MKPHQTPLSPVAARRSWGGGGWVLAEVPGLIVLTAGGGTAEPLPGRLLDPGGRDSERLIEVGGELKDSAMSWCRRHCYHARVGRQDLRGGGVELGGKQAASGDDKAVGVGDEPAGHEDVVEPLQDAQQFDCGLRNLTGLQRNFDLCIPRKGIARPRSQFPQSCVCERFIYSQDRSTYFLQPNRQTDHRNI